MFEDAIRRPSSSQSRRRGAWASGVAHAVMALAAAWMFTQPRSAVPSEQVRPTERIDVTWIPTRGPSRGGGSGGENTPDVARERAIGNSRAAVAVPAPLSTAVEPTAEPPPDPVMIAAIPVASGVENFTGLIAPAQAALSHGPGRDGGAGTNEGGGRGDGDGPGVDSGSDGGIGADAFSPGNGVTTPQLIREVKPAYTTDAVRAKVQGVVRLECVVLPNGSVGPVKVITSLDTVFGLDEEAIKAAREWRFVPGRRLGQPVAVRVVIELGFRLR